MQEQELSLFPLRTVLFPGALLPLRIFESRYVDMVGRCLRSGASFGVVLILEGSEAGEVASMAQVGSSARIVDFESLPDGLLGLMCVGERRFRVLQRSQQSDGLHCAQVQWLAEPQATPLAAQFAPLVAPLRRVMDKLGSVGRFVEPDYQDSGWVSYRLAELLPLDPATQQRLLELDDSQERLRLLAPLLELPRGRVI